MGLAHQVDDEDHDRSDSPQNQQMAEILKYQNSRREIEMAEERGDRESKRDYSQSQKELQLNDLLEENGGQSKDVKSGCPSDWVARDDEADEALLFGMKGSQNTFMLPLSKKCRTPAAPTKMQMLRKSKERIEKEDELVTEKPNSLRRSERLSNKQSHFMKSESHYNV